MKHLYKSLMVFLLSALLIHNTQAQRFSLYNSGTLYDALENPATQMFTDSCKKFAITNLFYTNFNTTSAIQGPLSYLLLDFIFLKNATINSEDYGARNGRAAGNLIINQFNYRLLGMKIRLNQARASELSFDIGAHVDSRITVKDELLNLVTRGNYPYRGQTLNGIFNTNSFAQSYLEAAVGYRQNVSPRLGFGVKLSILSGIAAAKANIDNSYLFTDGNLYPEYVELYAKGTANTSADTKTYSGSNAGQKLANDVLGLKNPGFGGGFGATYKLNKTFTLTGGIRDFGIIFWNNQSKQYTLDKKIRYDGADAFQDENARDSAFNALTKVVIDTQMRTFRTYLPASAEFGINAKPLTWINTTLQLSKRVYTPDLDVYLVNDLRLGPFHFIVNAGYNTTKFFSIGGTFLIKTRGTDIYFTSEQAANTINASQRVFDRSRPSNLPYAVNYGMGMAFKFGRCPKAEEPKPLVDSDLDGLPDVMDDCPMVAGPFANKGCPILDTDEDGVLDSADRCPTVKGPIENKGCPYEDTDSDGILDKDDACPTQIGPLENKGCPYIDSDSDGVLDKDDKCPTAKGSRDNGGCPFDDIDGDGLLDKDDKCPTVSGPIANKGCPYSDTDGDGILDDQDKCPTVKGVLSNGGCPEEPKKVELTKEEQEVINKVFKNLNFQTGKAIIATTSYNSLDELVALLKKKENFRLLIEGHTDNVGSLPSNIKLSQNRADAVKRYFTDRGIFSDRLTAVGYGPNKPVAPNTTPEGRAKNRRVEFTIIE